ncbi:MAG: hypothetical protein JW841_00995 [Deltaproteobacteria bacterium]|nr:hypothetical protein [Deltaproteobacteria bacterium]
MKVALDFIIHIDDVAVDADTLLADIEKYKGAFSQASDIKGAVITIFDGETYNSDYSDPLLRLSSQWISKLPWVLGGDTETVALRNSEHCYAFMPAGDSVELSFFAGSENEVEEYVIEPSTIRLDAFANESIKLCERILDVIKALNSSLLEDDEDCRELITSLNEGRDAWRDHQLHTRR